MNPLLVATAVLAAVAAVAVVGLVVAVTTSASGRRRYERELRTSRESVERLRARVEELSRALDLPAAHRPPDQEDQEFVITSLGDELTAPADEVGRAPAEPSGSAFAALAARESLIRLVSLGYGVRRALSAESRNRIRFEVGREIRRARKVRRHELKEARRHLRAQSLQEAR